MDTSPLYHTFVAFFNSLDREIILTKKEEKAYKIMAKFLRDFN